MARTPNTYCEECKKPLYRRPHQLKTHSYISCIKCKPIVQSRHPENWENISKKDYGFRFKKGQKMGHSWNYKGEKPLCKCGKRLAYFKSKQCVKCAGISKRINLEGFSKRRIDNLERKRFGQTIQKQVLKRDDYTCQICGKRGGDLQVDHIQSWAEYIEMRFCIDNCRTLCVKCHYKITYGKPMPPTVKAWGHNLLKGGTNL